MLCPGIEPGKTLGDEPGPSLHTARVRFIYYYVNIINILIFFLIISIFIKIKLIIIIFFKLTLNYTNIKNFKLYLINTY